VNIPAVPTESTSDAPVTSKAHVVGTEVVVQDVDATHEPKIADLKLAPLLADAAEEPESLPVAGSWKPLDLVHVPEQPVAADEAPCACPLRHQRQPTPVIETEAPCAGARIHFSPASRQ
jgi:hypothetical protein